MFSVMWRSSHLTPFPRKQKIRKRFVLLVLLSCFLTAVTLLESGLEWQQRPVSWWTFPLTQLLLVFTIEDVSQHVPDHVLLIKSSDFYGDIFHWLVSKLWVQFLRTHVANLFSEIFFLLWWHVFILNVWRCPDPYCQKEKKKKLSMLEWQPMSIACVFIQGKLVGPFWCPFESQNEYRVRTCFKIYLPICWEGID